MSVITVVTGLPRSGTSLMMQILAKAGLPVMEDGKRTRDESNPEGYYELEAVKGIVKDNSFLLDAGGKAIKIVAPLPIYMKTELNYRVVFMRRDIEEILLSQEKMLQKDQRSEREKFRTIYEFHLKKTYAFLRDNNIPYLNINYNLLLSEPLTELTKLVEFLKCDTTAETLAAVVNPTLYRNRNEQ